MNFRTVFEQRIYIPTQKQKQFEKKWAVGGFARERMTKDRTSQSVFVRRRRDINWLACTFCTFQIRVHLCGSATTNHLLQR